MTKTTRLAENGSSTKEKGIRKVERIKSACEKFDSDKIGENVRNVIKKININHHKNSESSEAQGYGSLSEIIEMVRDVINQAQSDSDFNAQKYEVYSMFGPLVYWLMKIDGNEDLSKIDDIEQGLRKLRLKMAQRDGISIVAHRGHGPSNRTRGGLIQDDDERRLNRPAENSENAFKRAFEASTGTASNRGLDGVECDVFLSKDKIPILSHEGNVVEQLLEKNQVSAGQHVDDLTAEELKGIKRTGKQGSNFITLEDFLKLTESVAVKYYNKTERPYRIEIEMKGKPSSDEGKSTYSMDLAKKVAKDISRFKKSRSKPWCWEFILFNGSEEDAQSYHQLRREKTHLGGVYVGLGKNDAASGRKVMADELRMALTEANIEKLKKDEYKDFIMTLVPGAERPYDDPEALLRSLDFGRLALKKMENGGSNRSIKKENKEITGRRKYASGVNKDMLSTSGSERFLIDKLLRIARARLTHPNIHLLTDIPDNAIRYKQRV